MDTPIETLEAENDSKDKGIETMGEENETLRQRLDVVRNQTPPREGRTGLRGAT